MCGCINDAATQGLEHSLQKAQGTAKVLTSMAAPCCMEPVATEMLSLCGCVILSTHSTKVIPASALPRPVHSTVYFTSKQLSHLSLYDQEHGCFHKPLLALEERVDSE